MNQPDIYKAAGVLIKDQKMLAVRPKKNPRIMLSPGGKIEPGETPKSALIRELMEELQITVKESDLIFLETVDAPASDDPTRHLRMEIFLVKKWAGEIQPASEIEECVWIDSKTPAADLGSVIANHMIPYLVGRKLID